jgi:hypothetical protein
MPTYGAGNSGQRDIPLSQIEDMQRKGLTNSQIIQTLQRDGFSSTQIFDALNQANLQPTHQMGGMLPQDVAPPGPGYGMPQPPGPSMGGMDMGGSSNEELIEAIIDEKWNDLVKDVNKIVAWKEAMTQRIEKLEQRQDDLKADYDKLHEGVIGKVGEYDKNILEVGAEVRAMEKVFSKVLPVFTENVAELSRITDRVRAPPGKK